MPFPACRSGRLIRLLAILFSMGVVAAACSFGARTDEDGAAVLGNAAQLPGKYVSPQGNNGNSGNAPDQAYKTVAYAVKQLSPGDTLYVMEGEYFENERPDSSVAVTVSGTADAWITVTAFPGATPILRSNQSNGIKVEGASYVEISNLELIGNPNGGTASYSGSGINVDAIYGPAKNHHVRVLNNTISGFGAGGIPVTGSSHVEIRGNVVYDVANVEWTQHSGISILESFNMGFGNDGNGYSNYITGNTVYRVENKVRDRGGRFTDGNCIIMDRTNINSYSGRTLIANNLCLDSGGRGVQIFESKHADVVNNTIYQNLRTGEIASGGGELGSFYSSDIHFANNVVFTRSGLIPARTYDSSNVRFTNNLYVGNTDAQYNGAANNGDRRVGEGTSVVASPGTNPNPANFKLSGGSPAINAGTGAFNAVVKTDFHGAARPAGGATDIGAFESGSSAPATTAPAAPTTAAPTTAAPTTKAPVTTNSPTTKAPATSGPSSSSPQTTQPGAAPTTTADESADSGTTASTAVPRPPTTAGADQSTPSTLAFNDSVEQTPAQRTPASTSSSSAPVQPPAADSTVSEEQQSSSTDAVSQSADASATESADSPAPLPTRRGSSTTVAFNAPAGATTIAIPVSTIGTVKRSSGVGEAAKATEPPSSVGVTDAPASADAEQSAESEAAAPNAGPLAFEDPFIPQAPVPPELPVGIVVSLCLTLAYYRPTVMSSMLGRLLNRY